MESEAYRITSWGVAEMEKEGVSKEVIKTLKDNIGRSSGSEDAFMGFLITLPGFAKLSAKHKTKMIDIFFDPYALRLWNSMEIGEVFKIEKGMRVRRFPGGWLVEYYNEGIVTASLFLNTNDIADRG